MNLMVLHTKTEKKLPLILAGVVAIFLFIVLASDAWFGTAYFTLKKSIKFPAAFLKPSAQNICANTSNRDMWVWDETVATNRTAKSRFFNFTDSQLIRTAYLHSFGFINSNQTALSRFINDANSHCMKVELLAGDPLWSLTPYHDTAVSFAEKAVTFTRNLTGTKPVAVHYDVEPHALPSWTSDQNNIANQYLDLLERLAGTVRNTDLKLVVDMPFWYDEINITRNGQPAILSNAVMNIVDRVTIMDYRDTADQIISLAQSEMSTAGSLSKKAVIGVETTCNLDPTYISFCEEGLAAMNSALTQVNNTYVNDPAFGGFAVHHYGAYKALKP